MNKKPLVLMILDGFGNAPEMDNAIKSAVLKHFVKQDVCGCGHLFVGGQHLLANKADKVAVFNVHAV